MKFEEGHEYKGTVQLDLWGRVFGSESTIRAALSPYPLSIRSVKNRGDGRWEVIATALRTQEVLLPEFVTVQQL